MSDEKQRTRYEEEFDGVRFVLGDPDDGTDEPVIVAKNFDLGRQMTLAFGVDNIERLRSFLDHVCEIIQRDKIEAMTRKKP